MQITAITQQVKRTNRYSIFVDDKYAFSLSEGALILSGISSGQELDTVRLTELKKLSTDDKLYNLALRYVTIRLRSTWEMQEYLKRKGCDPTDMQRILNKLSILGLIGDNEFAQRWVANRRLLKPTSRRKLQLELRQKHISSDIIDIVLREDTEVTDERTVIRDLIARKRSYYPDKQKLMAFLARRGFSYDDIKAVLDDGNDSF